MFSGLIQDVGTITQKGKTHLDVQLKAKPIRLGDSVAINGVCLTVVRKSKRAGRLTLRFEVSQETINKTTFRHLKAQQKVNIETALKMQDALGGHIVQGHVDAMGRVKKIKKEGTMKTISFQVPAALKKYIVSKGSVTVDGVSLTAARLTSNGFTVALIPYTLRHTNLNQLKVGDSVNIETDVLGKYVLKYLKK